MDEESDNSRVVAVALGSFFPGDSGKPVNESDREQFTVAIDWQQLATVAQFAEPRGVLAGMPRGYMAEVIGRAAAAGEQLGLALTAIRDAEVWESLTPEAHQENRQIMAGRALAEASGLWSISTAHAAVNVVARVLRAHKSTIHLDKQFKWNGPPAPFSTEPFSNLSLNAATVKALRRAARESIEAPLEALVSPLSRLVVDAHWKALTDRRDVGYHRWRPQSIEGGALTTNPWVEEDDNTMSLSVGVSTGHVPPTLHELVTESRAGYNALSTTMRNIHASLPAAMVAAGIGVWTVD